MRKWQQGVAKTLSSLNFKCKAHEITTKNHFRLAYYVKVGKGIGGKIIK